MRKRWPRALRSGGTAAIVAAALLMTACGGGEEETDDVPGVDDTAAKETSGADDGDEQPSEPAPDDIDRPDIEVADTLDLIFEDVQTEDAVEQEILYDNQQQIRAVFEVLTTHDKENSSLSFYTAGEALIEDMQALDRVIDQGISSGGSMVFYDREVTNVTEDTAVVSYCRDFSEVYDFDFETEETIAEPDSSALPTHTEAWLEINDSGVWQTTVSSSEQKSEKCQ